MMCACSVAKLCLTLCVLMDCSPPGYSVHGVLQARILKKVAMPSSRGSSRPRDRASIFCISCIASGSFTTEPPGKPNSVIRKLNWQLPFKAWEYPARNCIQQTTFLSLGLFTEISADFIVLWLSSPSDWPSASLLSCYSQTMRRGHPLEDQLGPLRHVWFRLCSVFPSRLTPFQGIINSLS